MIRTVCIVGRGAVGLTVGELFDQAPAVDFAFVCDPARKEKYQRQPVSINGTPRSFPLLTPEDGAPEADLILFACKSYSLAQAMEEAAPFVSDSTILMSAINGISSEEQLQARFPQNPVLHTIAQKMDSCYDSEKQTLTFHSRGELVYGADDPSMEACADEVERLFQSVSLPYRRSDEIVLDQCRKLMANCGLNQICALYDATYGDIAQDEKLNRLFFDVMSETRRVLAAWGYDPGSQALDDWMETVARLDPDSMPSMAQDMKAGRPIELDLFSGRVLQIARQYGVAAPLLQMLYDGLRGKTARKDMSL